MIGSYAYLATRIAILKSRLLPESYFTPFVQSSLDESFEKRTGIPLSQLDDQELSLDSMLMRLLLNDLSVIRRPLTGDARKFFTFWARRFEIFNLKSIIRGKQQRRSYAEIKAQLQEIPPFSSLSHESMLQSENVSELLRLIERGPYSSIARHARAVFESSRDSHSIEAAVDLYYYNTLLNLLSQLPKEDSAPALALIGIQIDRLNLCWLVRYRFTYKLSSSEAYYFLIRKGHLLTREKLLKLSEQESLDALIGELPQSIKQYVQNSHNHFELEQHLEKMVRESARRCVNHSPSVITRALGYLLLRECDLNHIRTMVIGKRLNMEPYLQTIALGHRAEAYQKVAEHV